MGVGFSTLDTFWGSYNPSKNGKPSLFLARKFSKWDGYSVLTTDPAKRFLRETSIEGAGTRLTLPTLTLSGIPKFVDIK